MALSGFIVDEKGWKAPFFAGLLFSVLGLMLAFFIPEPKKEKTIQPVNWKDIGSILTDRFLLRTSFMSIIAHGIMFSTIFGFTTTYPLSLGFQTQELTGIVLTFMIPHAPATLLIGNVMVPVIVEWKSLFTAFLLTTIFTFSVPVIQTKITF